MAHDIENKRYRSIDRLHDFAEWCKEEDLVKSLYSFEKECGLSPKYLTNAAQLKGNVSCDTLLKVYKRFPQLNVAWVVTGEGQMIVSKFDNAYKAAYEAAMAQVEALREVIKRMEERR